MIAKCVAWSSALALALMLPVAVDDPPVLTIIECGGSDSVFPPAGTLVAGAGQTGAEAKADLAGKLGLVCTVCASPGCQISVGSVGHAPQNDLSCGSGGNIALTPGFPAVIAVLFGTGGHCTASCSPCE